MNMTLDEIAKSIGLEYSGPADITITGLSSLSEAGENDISFVQDRKHLPLLKESRARAVIVFEGAQDCPIPHIFSPNPYSSFVEVARLFNPEVRPETGVSERAAVSQGAQVGKNVSIAEFCVVEDGASVGDDCIIYPQVYVGRNGRIGAGTVIKPNVTILDHTEIGQRCIIHSGAVIGSDGYGFTQVGAKHVKIPQMGNVIIGDDVEIGACVAIDRATFGSTRIGSGCKLDNLVHIAHNVSVGENTLLVAQVGIAGSTTIGRGATLAGQVGVAGHITLGDGVMAASKTGIPRDLPDGAVVGGIPAVPIREWRRQVAAINRLPETTGELKELKKQVEALIERLGG